MFLGRPTRQVLLLLLTAALLLNACNVGATPAPTTDVNALNTAIVGTTVAQFSQQLTQTAVAAPTNTPAPTETVASLSTLATLPTQDLSGAPSPTLNVAALPTFSFVNTPVTTGNTPVAGANTPVVLPTSAGQATASLGDACNNSSFQGDITIPDGTVLDPGVNFQKVWALKNTGTCTWDEGYSLVYIGGSTPNLDPYDFKFKNSKDFVKGGETINIAINLTTPCTPGKYEGTWRMRTDNGYFFGTPLSVYVEVKKKC
jgi:Ig-like domain-containing protein